MTFLIMCQGEQTRLADLGKPKHLIELDGETILARTVRMIREHSERANIIVIGREAFRPICWDLEIMLATLADPGWCVVDGIYRALPFWDQTRTTVLLGDVVWSRAALSSLIADKRSVVFAGTPTISASEGEIFGASWHITSGMIRTVQTCPCRVKGALQVERTFPRQQGGHMRRLLWWEQSERGLRSSTKNEPDPSIYLPISDYTDDIDEPADLERLDDLVELVRADRARTPTSSGVRRR